MDGEQVKYVRDLATVSHAVIKLLGRLHSSRGLQSFRRFVSPIFIFTFLSY